jgi:SAM-dependent methyltransferase
MNSDIVRQVAVYGAAAVAAFAFARQCRKPTSLLGRLVLAQMNTGHAALTAWGLGSLRIGKNARVLDVGCGGGRTIAALSDLAPSGRVSGIDYSAASVAVSRQTNAARVADGRVDVQPATVSKLPFEASTFDVVTAVETHYYWPELPRDVKEILRVLKPGGQLMLLAETYRGRSMDWLYRPVMTGLLGATYLTVDQHRDLLVAAGFSDVDVAVERGKGWIRAVGRRPV